MIFPMDLLKPKLMLDLIIIQHLLIHTNLLGERQFYPITLELGLDELFFYVFVYGLDLMEF